MLQWLLWYALPLCFRVTQSRCLHDNAELLGQYVSTRILQSGLSEPAETGQAPYNCGIIQAVPAKNHIVFRLHRIQADFSDVSSLKRGSLYFTLVDLFSKSIFCGDSLLKLKSFI